MDALAGGFPATAGTETLLRRWRAMGQAKREITMVAVTLTLCAVGAIWAWANVKFPDLPQCAPVAHFATGPIVDFACSPGPPVAQ